MPAKTMRPIGQAETELIASQKGLVPARVVDTTVLRFFKGAELGHDEAFARSSGSKLVQISWEEFWEIARLHGLTVFESNGYLRMMRGGP